MTLEPCAKSVQRREGVLSACRPQLYTGVCRVVLVRMAASTHSVQMDQRLLNLYTQVRGAPSAPHTRQPCPA